MQKPVSVSILGRHSRACIGLAVGLGVFGLAAPALAQTYDWVPIAGGTYTWSTPANWDPNTAFPNGDGVRANLIADFVPGEPPADPRGDFTVSLTANTTLNSLYFEDTGADPDARLMIGGSSYTLTFAGTTPIVSSNSSHGGGYGLWIAPTVAVGTAGVTKQGWGVVRFNNAITGSGNITVSSGTLEISGNSPAFTGQFIIDSGGVLEARSFGDTSINVLGSTDAATVLNGTGRFMFRDVTGRTSAEPFIINGIHASGSIRMYASKDVTITGPITLNNDVSFSQADWQNVQNNVIPPGEKKDFFINSVISQGTGGPYSAYFLGDYASTSAQGVNSRTGEMILGAQSTYGGNSYVTTNKANDASGSFSGNLRLGMSGALPATTTLVLGGAHSVKAGETAMGTLGTGAGNGKFALGGYNQALAGLLTSGTGTENRVVGNSATLSTLTLNIASDTTNTYAGYLGWTDTNDNNLALVKAGAGTLVLGAANTYAGGTTVSAGVLRPTNASALGSGSITVSSGGQLQLDAAGTYTISNAITIAGNGVPGNDGAITSKAGGVDVTLAGAITLTGSADIKTRGTSTTRVTIAGGVNGSEGNRNLYLFGDNGGRVVVRDNPINLGTGILGGGFDLNVAGNTAGRLVAQWNQTVNLGASNPFTTPPVLELGNNSGTNGYLGKLNLNGHAFTASGLVEVNTNTPGTSEVTDSTGGGTFTLNNASGTASTFAGKVTGNLALVKAGDGSLVLGGANTYTGATTVSGGTLRITNSGALGSTAAGTTVANFASLEVHGGISVAEPITITGGGYPQAQSWYGALRSTGGNNTWSGHITATGGTRIGIRTNEIFTLTGGITANSSVSFSGAAGGTIRIATTSIHLTGDLLAIDTTTTLLAVTGNTWSNTTISYGGTLKLGIDNPMPAATLVTIGSANDTSGTMDLNTHSQTIGGLRDYGTGTRRVVNSGGGTPTLTINNANSYAYAGVLGIGGQGSFNLTKTGAGTMTLAGINAYTGTTAVEGGTLALSHASSSNIISTSPLIRVGTGATLNVTGLADGKLALAAGQTLAGNGTVAGAVEVLSGAAVSPGSSVGQLTFTHNIMLREGATFAWEFLQTGTAGTDYDSIVGTDLILPETGKVNLTIAGLTGYKLSAGDSFTLFDGSVYQGATQLASGTNLTDLFTISDNIGWWGTWEVTAGSLVLTAVPEPSSLLLLAALAGLLVGFGRPGKHRLA